LTAEPSASAAGARRTAAANRLGLRLFGEQHRRYTTKNLAMCPQTLAAALRALRAGARGRTREQLNAALDLPNTDGVSTAVAAATADDRDLPSSSATSIWAAEGAGLRSEFADDIRSLGVDVATAQFEDRATVPAINRWVAKRTGGRIDSIVEDGDLGAGTVLLILSVLHFKAQWRVPFDRARTIEAPFHRLDGTVVEPPTMKRTGLARIEVNGHTRLLDLPFTGDDIGLRLIVPLVFPVPPAALEHAILRSSLEAERTVQMSVPRFSIEVTADLGATFRAMNLDLMFSAEADFSRMCRQPARVGRLQERVAVSIDEEGAEAAAAASVELIRTLAPSPVPFTVDRPFYYAIRDARTDRLLVIGFLADPQDERTRLN
jgi:serpin B